MDYLTAHWQVISAISGAFLGFICLSWRLVRGMRAILRDRIMQMYNHHVKLGYIRIHDLDNLEALYEAYKALGGNGTAAKLAEELRELPTLPKGEQK